MFLLAREEGRKSQVFSFPVRCRFKAASLLCLLVRGKKGGSARPSERVRYLGEVMFSAWNFAIYSSLSRFCMKFRYLSLSLSLFLADYGEHAYVRVRTMTIRIWERWKLRAVTFSDAIYCWFPNSFEIGKFGKFRLQKLLGHYWRYFRMEMESFGHLRMRTSISLLIQQFSRTVTFDIAASLLRFHKMLFSEVKVAESIQEND